MKKAHQALLRYLNLDVATAVETFKGSISDSATSKISLPYRENLDYILIRLQGLAKLLIRVISTSKKSATFYLGLIKAGSFYAKGIVFLSTLASIWSQSRDFCIFIVSRYNKLRSFRDVIKDKPEFKWIDGEYEVPKDLEVWLGDEWTSGIINETYDRRMLIREADITNFINNKENMTDVLSRMKDHIECDELNEVTIERPSEAIEDETNEFELDDSTPIPRIIKQEIKNDLLDHSLQSLTSKESIRAFIKNETMFRKVDPLKSITISKMRKRIWKEFQDDIKNKLLLLQDNTLLDYVNDYLKEYKVGA